MIDVLEYERQRRVQHVIEEIRGASPETPPERHELLYNRCKAVHDAVEAKPLTVGELRYMLGDHPEWCEVHVIGGRLKVCEPGEFEQLTALTRKPRSGKKSGKGRQKNVSRRRTASR